MRLLLAFREDAVIYTTATEQTPSTWKAGREFSARAFALGGPSEDHLARFVSRSVGGGGGGGGGQVAIVAKAVRD